MSWIAQQILAANKPEDPEGDESIVARNKRLELWEERARKGREQHTQKAVAAYRQVMHGKGWLTSWAIECSLGYARTSSTPFLKKLREDLKLIERRPKGGKPYNRKDGYEFRWIGE